MYYFFVIIKLSDNNTYYQRNKETLQEKSQNHYYPKRGVMTKSYKKTKQTKVAEIKQRELSNGGKGIKKNM